MKKKKSFFERLLSVKKLFITQGFTTMWLVWSLLAIVFVVDRLLKFWALRSCQEPVVLTSWLQCDLVMNRGVSFGLFHAHNKWVFGIVTIFVMALTSMIFEHARAQAQRGKSYIGELFIIAGSLSNLFDRFMYGGVIDFIIIGTPLGYWPAYNVADALIICGVALLIFTNYRES